MQLRLLLFALLLTQSAFAQITLEHTYPYANVRRVNIEGKVYYNAIVKQGSLVKCLWFDHNHNLVTNTQFTINPANAVMSYYSASATFFDSDPGIETVIGASASANSRLIVVDDNGSILLDKPEGDFFAQHVVNGQNRVVYGNDVYEVPSLQILHTFSSSASTNVALADLETTAPRYGILSNAGNLEFYDAQNFSLAETIEGDSVNLPCKPTLLLWDKYRVNADDDLEWMLFASCSQSICRYYSGSELLIGFQQTGQFLFTQFLPEDYQTVTEAKILIRSLSLTDTVSSYLYNIDPGQLELTLPGRWVAQRSDISDALLAPAGLPDTFPGPYPVVGLDQSPWESFSAKFNTLRTIAGVGEATFDGDADTKEALIRYSNPLTFQPVFFVQRASGEVLLQVDSMSGGLVSRLSGFDNKLIFSRSSVTDTAYNRSLVYSLPSSTPVETKEAAAFDLKVYPNPFRDGFVVALNAPTVEAANIQVHDVYGKLLYHREVSPELRSVLIDTDANWPSGLYFVTMQSGRLSRTLPMFKS